MIGKFLLFIYIVGISEAVLIDTSGNYNKDLVKTNSLGWQMVKMYHPPTQAYGYKYEHYAYPKYEFEYAVSDKKTGDHKHHHESRDGDEVRGEYSLVESDGSLRKVQYHADDHSGFNAIVSKTVNKHGNHAFSVSGQTRFFYPVGHNVKINHYFPGKNYHYQEIEKMENDKINKPVYEGSMSNKSETKMVMIESGDKLMVVEPMEVKDQLDDFMTKEVMSPTKTEEIADTPVEKVSTSVSVIQQTTEEDKINVEAVTIAPVVEKINDVTPNTQLLGNESQQVENPEQDSDAASSFHHIKYYYYY